MKTPRVLYEDNHLLVIDKPCGLATQGAQSGVDSVAMWAASYIKIKYRKPGNVFVGIVSRLDAAASGILVLARTSKAASRLSDQIRQRLTSKRYLAVVEGRLNQGAFGDTVGYREVVHYLRKNDSEHKMETVREMDTGAQIAISRLRALQELESFSVAEIDLVTGRKHQIRVQLSAIGNPVLGDRKYGASQNNRNLVRGSHQIFLHCYQLTVQHPTRRDLMTFHAYPNHWSEVLRRLNFDSQPLKLMCTAAGDAPRES